MLPVKEMCQRGTECGRGFAVEAVRIYEKLTDALTRELSTNGASIGDLTEVTAAANIAFLDEVTSKFGVGWTLKGGSVN